MVPLEIEYENRGKGQVPGVKVGECPGRVVGSLRGAQNQEWQERGNRSLKDRVMGTAIKGDGRVSSGVRQGVGGPENPSVGLQVTGGEVGGRSAGPGKTKVMLGSGEGCAEMRSCYCGCVI